MKCHACGKPLPHKGTYCPECGASQGSGASQELGLRGEGSAPADSPSSLTPDPSPLTPHHRLSLVASRLSSMASLDALLARANLLRMRGQWADAVELCTEALRADAHSAAAHSLLGDIYENQGRLDKAIHWYQLALDLDPESVADQAKLARARELQAVRKRTGGPRLTWAHLVAIAGVAFLFIAFVMAALVAGDNRRIITADYKAQLPAYPPAIIPKVRPPDHTTDEDDLRQSLADDLHSPASFMYVTAAMLDPLTSEGIVTVRIDGAVTPDPMGGGARGRILREGYRIAELAADYCRKHQRAVRFVTIRALSQLSTGSGSGPIVEVWQGRVDVTRLGVGDDQASADEVKAVYDPQTMYWNPVAGF